MTIAMLEHQRRALDIAPGTARNKWKLFRAICEARPALGVTDRALTVLDALLSFYPEDEISQEQGLIVFPSNAQLSLRARGMTPATLRRHLAALVEAGLILRKDSPNGKRYARRERDGEPGEAFGFSLAPLLSRAQEIETLAAELNGRRLAMRQARERLTICRRDISKLIETGIEAGVPGRWEEILLEVRTVVIGLARNATLEELEAALAKLVKIRSRVINRLETKTNIKNISGNESQIARHIQDSNTKPPIESEPRFESKPGGNAEKTPAAKSPVARIENETDKTVGATEKLRTGLGLFPLALVLQSCPQIADYGPAGQIGSWRDLMTAAIVVRSTLGISPSAYEQACTVMGAENAASVVACILERAGHIQSAGGYLRDLTRRAERGEFALGPMLMALSRANAPPKNRFA